jgi:hypothetical protein
MIKFIYTIVFGCEIHSLIAVLTLYAGFHRFPTTTLTTSPAANQTIYSTVRQEWGMYSCYPLAEGRGGVLGT